MQLTAISSDLWDAAVGRKVYAACVATVWVLLLKLPDSLETTAGSSTYYFCNDCLCSCIHMTPSICMAYLCLDVMQAVIHIAVCVELTAQLGRLQVVKLMCHLKTSRSCFPCS